MCTLAQARSDSHRYAASAAHAGVKHQMNLHLVIEFNPYNWRPHYRNIKKLLRKNRVPYKTKKRATDQGLLQSIWADENHIEKARELVSSYDIKDPYIIAQEERVEKLSKEFEKDWYWYLVAIFVRYPVAHPWYFLVTLVLVLTIILFPFVQYGLIG